MRKVWVIFLLFILLFTGCIQIYEYKYGVKYKVKVIRVIDGDTIYVLFPDGKVEKVRLLGIDTPEKIAKANRPYEYDNITDLEYLAIWGKKATRFVENKLNNTYVYIKFDELAGFRDKYGRLLAYVYIDGTDFNAELVKLGYARVYVEGKFKKKLDYLKLEEEAKRLGKGIWSILYKTSQTSIIINN
ncbi:MAG TPA: thermonuclease family protein [Archaeoglobus profundus]|nr:thermonuclease family protein [Archaeoglobus profundus]HIP57909.1 thermonuclease family protein [Archaeoglobus profundus]